MNASTATHEDLLYSVQDGIARITFNRPQARNALTFAMYERMAEICQEINADRSIKALILTGAGDKAFASGTDISQFRAFKTAQDALDYEARIDRVLGTLEQCRVPVIAAIAGACTGGGAGIAACCDLRIGHIGHFNDLMLMGTLAGVEMGLDLAKIPHRSGGVLAAMDVLKGRDAVPMAKAQVA